MTIYVGNISYELGEKELKEIFEEFGEVGSIKIITDKETGDSRGFSFVEMLDEIAGEDSIKVLDGKEFMGRKLKVSESKPKTSKPKARFKKK